MTQLSTTTTQNNAKLLLQANVPKQYLESIRQLIWSNDPANDLIALELVWHHGLPKELAVDFIIAAKKGRDSTTRDKIRAFLAGKLSDGAKQVLNNPTIITGSSISFYHYEQLINHSEIAQLAATYYKRGGRSECLPAFFRYDDGTSPHRQEMFTRLLPRFLSNPKYLKIRAKLAVEELNQVLANPVFQGKLERVILNSSLIKTIPRKIFKHQTIRDLELRGAFETDTLPIELFGLDKLTSLHLQWKRLKYIPSEINQLNQLQELYLHTEHSLVLPASFNQLIQLERAIFSNGIEESVTWKTAMPTVKF